MTRRELLNSAAAAWQSGNDGWFDRPMRWVQLAFVEDDPGRYDLKFWLDYFKRVHADAACLSAGGCVAFYPTKVPLHYKSKFMAEGTDPFGDLLKGCRGLGMNVIARVDPHAAHDDVYRAHPDWIAVDEKGEPRRHWAMASYWVTCCLGPYNFEFMRDVVREIMTTYEVDGIFANRWSGSGTCYCEHCRKNFRAYSGMELPRTNDVRDPVRRKYSQWHDARLFELWALWDEEIRRANPKARFIPNTGGGAQAEIDMKRAGALAPTLFADRQARSGVQLPWANGKNAKEYRATFGNKPIGGIFSIGLEAPYRWKDSVQSAAEIQVWAADGIAQGLRPWVTKFNAKPLDRRWLGPVEQLYTWHWKNERYLRNTENLARVGVVYSQQTARYAVSDSEEFLRGAYHALVEARIPFEMVHDGLLDAADLRRFKTLVLPNIAALSERQCGQLRAFVEAGGGLVATHETSLCDEWGDRRADFGLADLFGASYGGRTIQRQQNAYVDIADRQHGLLNGLQDAGRMIHGVRRVEVKPLGTARVPLTTMPSYPDLPMEEVYLRQGPTDIPAALCREAGKGRVVYFPWDIDRAFWEVLATDHGRLLANAVEWAGQEARPAAVEGPGLLDVALWRQERSMTLHLVNLTNPYAMKGPFREILPVAGQKVRVKTPAPKRARWLVAGAEAQFRYEGGWLAARSPEIGLHEVLAIDL
ncbi:MAG: ThuA domain-containing protein [Acidobacteria bacterium]|nr:ThuA domain-containing protein [Acidobacteriota bacterium]